MGKALKNILSIGGAIAVIGLIYVLWSNGFVHTSNYQFDGDCQALSGDSSSGPGLVGVEDIVIDHERKVAYLSATDRRDGANPRGAIYLMPLHQSENTIQLSDLTQGEPSEFHPHGIDLHISADGTRRLFVVSHDRGRREDGGAHVLIYLLGETGYLELEESVADDNLLDHPNDVAAIGPREFFATNDLSAPSKSMKEMIDIALHRKTGHVVHASNGKVEKSAIGPYAMPNGVSYDPASGTLYVVETLSRKVHAFRVTDSGGLIPLDRAATRTMGDNIAFAENGDIYLAGHLSMFKFMGHQKRADNYAPSDIVRFASPKDGDGLSSAPERIMISSGQPEFGAQAGLSAMTVAAVHKDIMLIGSVFEPRIWRCELAAR